MRARPAARSSARLWRALVPFGLVALLVIAGCGGGGGDGGGGEDSGGAGVDAPAGLPDAPVDVVGEDTPPSADVTACEPACDPDLCQVCQDGACATTCAETARCVGGTCQPTPSCESDGDCTEPCEVCDTAVGLCATDCEGDERCRIDAEAGTDTCEVPPACDCGPCEACDQTDVWNPTCTSTCTIDEQCHVVEGDGGGSAEGTCEIPPPCACGPCGVCDATDIWEPECVDGCTGEEQCHEGTEDGDVCEVPPACDCAPCEACDQTNVWNPQCVPLCDPFACETCGEDGETCVSTCDVAACEVCDDGSTGGNAGDCVFACDPASQYCRDGACLERPDVACDDVDGFCDGSIIDELVLQASPDAETGEPGCCCDLTGDGVIDNGLADLIVIAEPFLHYDRTYFNEGIAGQILHGLLLLAVEYLGVDDVVNDDHVTFNIYLASDTDEDWENNLTGAAEFWVQPESLDSDQEPLMAFRDGWIENGRLHGGPADFLMPLDLVGQDLPILLVVEGTTIEADITTNGVGYGLENGRVCGWIHREKIALGVNEFAATNCGCLGYSGDFILLQGGTMTCAPTTTTCPSWDFVGQTCNQLATACGALTLLLPALFDLDLTEDGKGDAITLGVTLGGVGAALVGVAPSQ